MHRNLRYAHCCRGKTFFFSTSFCIGTKSPGHSQEFNQNRYATWISQNVRGLFRLMTKLHLRKITLNFKKRVMCDHCSDSTFRERPWHYFKTEGDQCNLHCFFLSSASCDAFKCKKLAGTIFFHACGKLRVTCTKKLTVFLKHREKPCLVLEYLKAGPLQPHLIL